MAVRSYTVLRDFAHPEVGRGVCRSGGTMELTDGQARYLRLGGFIEAAPERSDREAAFRAAIAGLEEGNPDHWTRDGRPEVKALREAAGLDDLTAAERNAAWAAWGREG